LIQLERLPGDVEALPLAPRSPRPGQRVHSVGNPGRSGGMWVYTSGTVRHFYQKKWSSVSGLGLTSHEAMIVETQSPTNAGDSGGPLVNDRGELIAITQGGDREANLQSCFIDVTEVRSLLTNYATVRGVQLTLETGSGLGTEASVPDLLRALENTDAKTRAKAALALGEMGPDARLAVPALLQALKDADELIRKVSSESLDKIGAPAKNDVSRVAVGLKDPDPRVRLHAARALARLGKDAAGAVHELTQALNDPETAVRRQAASALGSLGPEGKSAASALFRAAKDPDAPVRRAAVAALSQAPPAGEEAVALPTGLLKDGDPQVRESSAHALGKLANDASAAVGPLSDALQDRCRPCAAPLPRPSPGSVPRRSPPCRAWPSCWPIRTGKRRRSPWPRWRGSGGKRVRQRRDWRSSCGNRTRISVRPRASCSSPSVRTPVRLCPSSSSRSAPVNASSVCRRWQCFEPSVRKRRMRCRPSCARCRTASWV
jgi:HEAT repeat protein